jgi:hypothetical protein
MAIAKSKVKTPVGMMTSHYWPIKSEPENSHPVYDAAIDMGAAVKGYISVTTASASIPGDDIAQVEIEKFTGGQFDAETTMSELEVNAKIYGHAYDESGVEISSSEDVSPNGGYSFIEPMLTKEKKTIYRATCLMKVSAMASSERQEADTKKPGELAPKMCVVSYKIMEDSKGVWRKRQDFETKEAATQFINTTFGAAAT